MSEIFKKKKCLTYFLKNLKKKSVLNLKKIIFFKEITLKK